MDGVSVAASILGIATAGVQISIKLVTLATQISTAADRVSAIGNDVSLTSGVLRQLGELMTQRGTGDGDGVDILNQHGVETTRTAALMCERIFQEIQKEVKKASEQLRKCKPGRGRMTGEKIELSATEKAIWPFFQPRIDTLKTDLRDAKSTLMMMLQVASLALSKRMADATLSRSEHQDLVRAIVALELQRRDERTNPTSQQDRSKRSSPNDTPNRGNAITSTPREYTSTSDPDTQAPAFPNQKRRKRTTGVDESPNDSSQARNLFGSDIDPGVGPLKGQKIGNAMNKSPANTPGSKPKGSPWPNGNSNVPGDQSVDPAQPSIISDIDKETQINHDTELQLFFLKPIVTDFFDRIELRWSVQNTNTQSLDIRQHMADIEKDHLPSVIEMLQQLHAYEQKIVEQKIMDSETSEHCGASVLSLKRTKTDIQCRDMLFKAVPGLQFVIQRPIRQPQSFISHAGTGHGSIGENNFSRPGLDVAPYRQSLWSPSPSEGKEKTKKEGWSLRRSVGKKTTRPLLGFLRPKSQSPPQQPGPEDAPTEMEPGGLPQVSQESRHDNHEQLEIRHDDHGVQGDEALGEDMDSPEVRKSLAPSSIDKSSGEPLLVRRMKRRRRASRHYVPTLNDDADDDEDAAAEAMVADLLARYTTVPT